VKWTLPTLLGLGACASCPPLDEQPVLAACILGELPEPQDDVRRLIQSGRVDQFGRHLAEDCGAWSIGDVDRAGDPELAQWFSVGRNNGNPALRIGIWSDDWEPPEEIRRRERWSIDARIEDGRASWLDIRDESNRAVFWLGAAPSVADLVRPPGLIVEEGRPVCRRKADCGTLKSTTLEVEVEHTRAELRPHERLEAKEDNFWSYDAEHTVVHGGSVVAADEDCDDEAGLIVAWWER